MPIEPGPSHDADVVDEIRRMARSIALTAGTAIVVALVALVVAIIALVH